MTTHLASFRRLTQRISLTEGEQSILLAFFGVAFFGAALAFNIVMTLGSYRLKCLKRISYLALLHLLDVWELTDEASIDIRDRTPFLLFRNEKETTYSV